MIHVIYFNQWFSSMTEIIKDIKSKHGNSIKIIASSKNPLHAYKYVADKFIVEDWDDTSEDEEVKASNYTSWLRDIFEEYRVDLAFINRHASWVSSKIEDSYAYFGAKIVLEDNKIMNELRTKSGAYKKLANNKELNKLIPIHYTDTSLILDILTDSYKLNSRQWCFKLNSGTGGSSFRKIVGEHTLTLDSLNGFRMNTVRLDETIELFKSIENNESIIFMGYLEGPEISVDCYNSSKGFYAICREKMPGSRVQNIYREDNLTIICSNIAEHIGLKYPFNAQFRTDPETKQLKLIDINLRLSGGVYYETEVGINLAEVCILDSLEFKHLIDYNKFYNLEKTQVTHFEKAVRIE